ncbi:hypothetical protein ACIBO9_28540 [Streptomyces prunicolor]|uniref:hypothetical protein n=1 Tax=Streptomyces prunicolor TaxID=67348 RepID=UPI0037D7BC9D
MEWAGIRLATAFRVVFDTAGEQVDTESGKISPPQVATLTAMWERIEEWCRARSWPPRCTWVGSRPAFGAKMLCPVTELR